MPGALVKYLFSFQFNNILQERPKMVLTTEDTDFTENSQLCVLGSGNAPNIVCALATRLHPQGLIALL